MISFKEYLTEARMAPLFHATTIVNAHEILNHGFEPKTYQTIFKGMKSASWGRYGISTARSMKSSDDYMRSEGYYRYVVFELDQQKLNSRYQIIPVDWFGTNDVISKNDEYRGIYRREQEEFIIVKNGKNIKTDVIKKIYYFKKDLERVQDFKDLKDLKDNYPEFHWVERK